MSDSPFDEWPEYYWGDDLITQHAADSGGHIGQHVVNIIAWREKWQSQILAWKERAEIVDAYLNCPGNCEQAWHDCGCALFDALRGSEPKEAEG